jgi:hypothetical protein
MEKRTLVATDFNCRTEMVRNELCLVVESRGLTLSEYKGNANYSHVKQTTIYLPLWAIPYMMEQQRKAIADWEEKQLEFIDRIKEAYNTEVKA